MKPLIKMRLGFTEGDTSKDMLIDYYISLVETEIFNYCHISILPKMLEPLVIEKVVTLMRQQADPEQEVKSVSRGDTKIDYSSKASIPSTLKGDILSDVKQQLAPYRKNAPWHKEDT